MSRSVCQQCHRPTKTCLCDLTQQIDNRVELLIWQHPSESMHPKGSAPLLDQSLTNSSLIIAEQLTQKELEAKEGGDKRTYLLFPPQEGEDNPQIDEQENLDHIRLLVLDGTWRKARKLLYLNPWLQQLPRLTLAAQVESRYRIRKAERANQLSTLEASCMALAQLESDSGRYQPLLQAFDQYVERIEAFMPSK